MYIIVKLVVSLLSGFLLSILIGSIMIPIFSKFKMNQNLSVYLKEAHRQKKSTPTMGGLIFGTSTLITLLVLYFGKTIETLFFNLTNSLLKENITSASPPVFENGKDSLLAIKIFIK